MEQVINLDAVREVIVRELANGHPTLNRIAKELAISPRTLQRRLLECGVKHSELVKEVRLDFAASALINTPKPIAAIAHRLGYADASSFTRAFECWTGLSPREFRKQAD